MHHGHTTPGPLLAFGMAALVLGTISLLLAFLPILGIPVAALGALFALVGLVAALDARGQSLRWSLAGLAVSLVALGVNVAIYAAPQDRQPGQNFPRPWPAVPDRPFVAPPARGELDEGR